MALNDDIKLLQQQGKNEIQVRTELLQKGYTSQQVSDGLAQSQIKEAVSGLRSEPNVLSSPEGSGGAGDAAGRGPLGQNFDGMQPSLFLQSGQENTSQSAPGPQVAALSSPPAASPPEMYAQPYNDEGDSGQYPSYGAESYQPYQQTMSSDLMADVAEQIVSDKLSYVEEKIDKVLDFRTTAETRIRVLEERLSRIEQILDRLQLSLLHRMGEYVQDVRDIKQELVETQKSFKSIAPQFRGVTQPASSGMKRDPPQKPSTFP